MPLEVKAALVCDLTRLENTGKYILIGVYTGSIIFRKKPATFAPTFWIEFAPHVQDAKLEVEIKIEAPGLKKPRAVSAKTTVGHEKSALLTFTVVPPIEVAEPGVLKLGMRLKGSRWRTILAKEIEFADSSLPAA